MALNHDRYRSSRKRSTTWSPISCKFIVRLSIAQLLLFVRRVSPDAGTRFIIGVLCCSHTTEKHSRASTSVLCKFCRLNPLCPRRFIHLAWLRSERDPVKAKMRKRYFCGLREVHRSCKLKQAKVSGSLNTFLLLLRRDTLCSEMIYAHSQISEVS